MGHRPGLDDMDTETQQTLRAIRQGNLDTLTKLQAETARLIDETVTTQRWSRRWEPVLMATSCLAVCSAITAVGADLIKMLFR